MKNALLRLRQLWPVLFFVAVFLLGQNWWRLALLLDPIDPDSSGEVVLYTTSWCPYCNKAREYLDQAGIPFQDFDIEKSPVAQREYTALQGRGVPVIVVGDTVVHGFDRQALRRALEPDAAADSPP